METHKRLLVTGLYNDQLLQDLHIKLAFVFGAGFTPEAGLTEPDIRIAQLKSKMITAANTVVALIDSAKFGKDLNRAHAQLLEIGAA